MSEKNKKELEGRMEVFEKTGRVIPRGTPENRLFDVKIDDWEILQLVKQKIKELQMEINMKWYQMAKYIYIIWRDKAWELEGCDSWSEWVAQNYEFLGRGLRQVERLIRVWRVLVVDLKQPIEDVAQLSSTNAYEITRYAKKSNVKDLVELAQGNETRALKQTLKQIDPDDVSKDQIFHCEHENTVILVKCKECKEMFYRIPETAKILVDKGGIIDHSKVNADVVKDSPS